MDMNFFKEVLQDSEQVNSEAMFDDGDTIIWVDWREAVETIVDNIQQKIPGIELAWALDEENEDGFTISVGKKSKKFTATEEKSSQHGALLAISELLGSSMEIRYVAETNGGDTAGIVVGQTSEWLQLFQSYGQRLNENFVPVTLLPDIFNAPFDAIESAMKEYAANFDVAAYAKLVSK